MSEFSSPQERLELIQRVNGLTQTQFDEVVFALEPPGGIVPGTASAQGNRGKALLDWAESSTGCGIRAVVDILETYVPNLKDILPEPAANHWLVPYPRNPFFTGRQDLLEQLRNTLTQHNRAALTQHSRAALSGLGGIGKTQTAVEYVYRYRDQYPYVFWVRAEPAEELLTGYSQIAEALKLPGYDPTDRPAVVGLVKRWLETHEGWLLVIDNADDIRAVRQYLPRHGSGHLLLTTRAQSLGEVAQPLEVAKMELEEGALFLLRRAGITTASAGDVEVGRAIVQDMDGLPLALDQAGAYIEEQFLSLEEYRELFETEKTELLKERGQLAGDHPSVTVTFKLAFEKVAERNAAAADLLRVCAFIAPDDIPEEIFSAGEGALGEALSTAAESKLGLSKAIAEAARFSLIRRNTQAKTVSIHRLVQSVLRDEMEAESQREWAEGVVEAVTEVFPNAEYENWLQCDRVMPHAQVTTQLITSYGLASETAALLLSRTGYYFDEQGLYSEAEPLLQHALAMNQQLLGENHPAVATSLNNLADLYDDQGRYAEAEPLYRQALTMRQQLLGENHPAVATSLNNLAELYESQGRYAEAESLHRQALTMRQQLLGENHPAVALSLNNLGLLYKSQSRYAEAEPLYRRALTMRQQLLGENHPAVATSLNNLGSLYSCQGLYEEAEPLYRQALTMRQQLLGESHPAVALSLNNLGLLYYNQGRYAEAESLYQKALQMRQQLLGEDHPAVATSLNNLATLYDDQGRYEEAEPLLQRALQMRQQLLGESHPDVATSLNNLAGLYESQGRYTEAEPLYQQALAICEKNLGPEHPHTQLVRDNLQRLLENKD